MTREEINYRAFIDYANSFDTSVFEIDLKIKHSLRVALLAGQLAGERGELERTAVLAGLLHDFGRLEQFTEYKTFDDLASVDHGELACRRLFMDGLIDLFNVSKSEYAILFFAIFMHNKRTINFRKLKRFAEEGEEVTIDKKEVNLYSHKNTYSYVDFLNLAHIVRDADKVDIYFQMLNSPATDISDKENGITQRLLEDFKVYHSPRLADVKTKLDFIFVRISFIFDIRYLETFSLFSVEDVLRDIKKKYSPFLNAADKKTLDWAIQHAYDFLQTNVYKQDGRRRKEED